MLLFLNSPGRELGTVKYYQSFDGYSVPFTPLNELPFESTSDLKTFYIGQSDSRERLVKFLKIALERGPASPFRLKSKRKPGERVFFKAVPPAEPTQPLATPIPNEETENLSEYFAGKVGDDGLTGEAHLMRRVKFFEDAYEYGSGESPERRVLTREDGSQIVQALTVKQGSACDEADDKALKGRS